MYENIYQQSESVFKQFNEILSLNVEAFSTLFDKQTAFVNAMVSDGIDYAKGLPSQKSVEAVYESQKAYWENVQQKISDNAKDSFELINQTSEKITGMLQGVVAANDSVKAAPVKATAAQSVKKKVAPKSVKKAEPAPEQEPEVASISEEKPVSVD